MKHPMFDLWDLWRENPTTEYTLLLFLALVVVLLLIMALFFAGAVLVLHASIVRRDARRRAQEVRWVPLLLAVLEGASVHTLWRTVRRGRAGAFLDLLVRFAQVIRGAEQERLAAVARPFLSVAAHQLRHREPTIRAKAVHTLGLLAPGVYARRLGDALGDPSLLVAATAARVLARSGEQAHHARVVDHLPRFAGWEPTFLTSMLVTMGPALLPQYLDLFRDEAQPPAIRAGVADALRWLNAAEAADTAAALLARDADREVLGAALRLLKRVGGPEHAEAVRPLCGSADLVVRLHAISALAVLGDARDLPCLLQATADPSRWVAVRAVRGLHESGHLQLLRQLSTSDHPRAHLARQVLLETGS